jgi:hypothetical protein
MARLPARRRRGVALVGCAANIDEHVSAHVPAATADVAGLAFEHAAQNATILDVAALPKDLGPTLL